MASSSERLADLERRMKEYEQVISSFEATNGNLRLRRLNASPEIKKFCDRHIEQNSRTIKTLREGLRLMKQQIANESKG